MKEKKIQEIESSFENLKMIEAERQISELIIAALRNNLLTQAEYKDKNYFEFCIKGNERHYQVCFGVNPDKTKYPNAERALRASEFVTQLLGLINREYNCYVVPPIDISGPNVSVVKTRLFGNDENFSVSQTRAVKGGEVQVDYHSIYELEVMINAAVDYEDAEGKLTYKYERITDSIMVDVSRAKGTASYEYRKLEKKAAPDENSLEDRDVDLGDVNRLMALVAKSEEKKRILETFSAAEESEFRKKFLDELEGKTGVRVGQINVQPCALYVEAITEKTFFYDVTVKGYKGKFQLKIVWNKLDKDFTSSTPLYILVEDGKFVGLTYRGSYTDEAGKIFNRTPFDEKCKIVIAHKIEKEALVAAELTLVPTDKGTQGALINEGIKDLPVKVSGVSSLLKNANSELYYIQSETVEIDGATYLKADCGKCAYTGLKHWNGNLTDLEVAYLDKQYTIVKGRISNTIAQEKNKRECMYCKSVYYAEEKRHGTYKQRNRLLDNTYYCSKCEIGPINIGNDNVKDWRILQSVYRKNETDHGLLYVKIKDKEEKEVVPYSLGGNAFVCGQCGKMIYYDIKGDPKKCETCNTPLGDTCYHKITTSKDTNGRHTYKFFNRDQHFCHSCDKKLMLSDSPNKRYEAYLSDEKTKGWVLAKKTKNGKISCLRDCVQCGKPIYYDSAKADQYERCDCCEKSIIGNVCKTLIIPDVFLKKKLCKICEEAKGVPRIESNGSKRSYVDVVQDATERICRAQEEIQIKDRENAELRLNWGKKVWEELESYAQYMNFFDRYRLLKAKRKGASWNEVMRISIMDEGKQAQVKDGQLYVRFRLTLTVREYAYVFVYTNGKITLEETL